MHACMQLSVAYIIKKAHASRHLSSREIRGKAAALLFLLSGCRNSLLLAAAADAAAAQSLAAAQNAT